MAGLIAYALVRIHEGPDGARPLGDRSGEVWTPDVDERRGLVPGWRQLCRWAA
jgi:hypothetical protein